MSWSARSSSALAGNGQGQKFLGERGLVALIAFLSAFVPLSTDLYLPALPGLANYFQVSSEQVNLTLILFFVFFAGGLLVWGPLSDRYGRRPVLLAEIVGIHGVWISLSLCCISGHMPAHPISRA